MARPGLAAVVVAAGSSRRMGFDKLTAPLAGRPVIAHSLLAFTSCPDVAGVVLVCAPARVEEFSGIAAGFPGLEAVVAGGAERADSVAAGVRALDALDPEFVAVHDGARPLVTGDMITACYRAAREYGAAVAAEPETDTLHRADENALTIENVPRDRLWRMQTPQILRLEKLRELIATQKAGQGAPTDEISLLLRQGEKARAVESASWNFKITYPRDLELAAMVLARRSL